jgi:TolB-like protein
MRRVLAIFILLLLALRVSAQTGTPVRLALIAESDAAASVADVLTAELSSQKNLQLLERNEIEKVYREQGLSARNKDYLKLGQILGADGLLLMDTAQEGTNQFLNVRLVAVRPGVVLSAERFSWPMTDLTEWSPLFARQLGLFLPKLTVLVKDAIPLSVVNLRSAIASEAAVETERQLKLLTIQRLSRERQFFVLERQRMQLITTEKDLKLDDSVFWNGSYLLEGVVDQNGYSQETITINARLTPPSGGTPLPIAVSGSRTNLAKVVDQLAAKVNEALKMNSTIKEWNAADEAAQYFDEANWALRWGAYSEAQMAADSAWALGKHDMDCATTQINAYKGSLKSMPLSEEGDIDASIVNSTKQADRDYLTRELKKISEAHSAVIFETNQMGIGYIDFNELPDPEMIDRAAHVLELYYDFSRTSAEGARKLFARAVSGDARRNSAWYQLGIDSLVAASKVLQDFNLVPASPKPVAEKLTALRALARSVASMLAEMPSEHDSYFVGDRFVTHDELTIEERPNIFRCKLTWGCLWQETPEDCLVFYRELMSSPVFCYIHCTFWSHRVQSPTVVYEADHNLEPARLVAWNEEDRRRIPALWSGFLKELDGSTNILLQLEAKALRFADANNEQEMGETFTNFFDALFANRDALLANNVEVLYLNWGADGLLEARRGIGSLTISTPDSLQRQFYSDYRPKLVAMDREYWDKTVPAQKTLAAFARQKQFLKENRPFDFMEFVTTFQEKNYSPAQALEIQPLVAAYKSNLVARSQTATGVHKGMQMGAISQVGLLENDLKRILQPAALPTQSPPQSTPPAVRRVAAPSAKSMVVSDNTTGAITNVIQVTKFLQIPLDGFPGDNINDISITAHHWMEGKLLLDVECEAQMVSQAIAVLHPETESWQVLKCPETSRDQLNRFYHHTTLWHGEVITSQGGGVYQFSSANGACQKIDVPAIGNCELFNVNDRLYAATKNLIVEILDGGGTHILVSNRRQPSVAALDSENLGTPTLFAGPGKKLRVATANKIYSWDGTNWAEVCPMPQAPLPPLISDDNVLFFGDGWNTAAGVWRLRMGGDKVEFCLGQEREVDRLSINPRPTIKPKSIWNLPSGLMLASLPVASRAADLFLLSDHAKLQDIVDEKQHVIIAKKIMPLDGYEAALYDFAPDCAVPLRLFLKFDDMDGVALPVMGLPFQAGFHMPGSPVGWMCVGGDRLFLSREYSDAGGDSTYFQKIGVWVIPAALLDQELNKQKH